MITGKEIGIKKTFVPSKFLIFYFNWSSSGQYADYNQTASFFF